MSVNTLSTSLTPHIILIIQHSTPQQIHFPEYLGKKTQSVNEIWPVNVILQKNKIIKIFCKNCNLRSGYFPGYSVNFVLCFMLRHLMTWWHLDIRKVFLIISKTERVFKVKWKAFFLVSKWLSFRHTKQTSKNVADTTFKYHLQN